ncbi:uncharacterized protein PV06_08719 [Exophiala oligosperma]|uniref:Zn(2)-C6 fungal-type domain-containing protein n=1 Tax=Exophiala oligosperma TaxID=215243 RepID=A0A0D2DTG4_9EURO|nr:uncharacterized protein PV06_08719 [Exophiala oligosperma]KIW38894.1 hypothetical protein PV06_08719 [Exophiala oligosperma]
MAATSSEASKRQRQSKACARCRKRKIRCDLNYPSCGACFNAGATCLGFDSLHGTDKPRSVARHLEERVAALELELAEIKSRNSNILDNVDSAVERLASRLATATAGPTGRSRRPESLLPLDSEYFLSDSPVPPFKGHALDGMKPAEPAVTTPRPVEISSIPRHVVDALLKHYCETYRPQYPSIGEEDLYRARDRVYEGPQLIGYEPFVVCITLAISSNTLVHIDEQRAAITTYGLWATAVGHLQQVGTTNSWERLQALQLLTHYGFLNPQHVSVSHCAAAASRLALQLGLHEELPISMQAELSSEILNTRRRMFWNALNIDAAVHIVRCEPFKWSKPEILAKFPDSESRSMPTHSAHMWSLREIECDNTLGLYYPNLTPDASEVNTSFEYFYTNIQTRLDEWYRAVRQSINLTEKIEFHELLFQGQVLRLNRPSPRCPYPNEEMSKKAIKASIALIKEFTVLQRLGKMFMIWHAAHTAIEAGVYLLSSALMGIESEDQDRQHLGGEDIRILIRYIKMFPSLIWKISHRWPSIVPHASQLESISTSVLEYLQQWSDGQDSWRTESTLIKEKLEQMTLFVPPSSQEQLPPQTTGISQTLGISSHLPEQIAPILGPAGVQAPGNQEIISIDRAWVEGQPGLDQTFASFPESYSIDYGDPMTWDFSGIASEEIFAALMYGGQSSDMNDFI